MKQQYRGFGDTFYIVEVFVKINGNLHYLWRAVDQDGEVADVYLQDKTQFSTAHESYLSEPSRVTYSARMLKLSCPLTAIVCLCLLAMQLSGLHLHIDTVNKDTGLHGTHTHQLISSDHDHNAEVDVQLLEQYSSSVSKLIPVISQVILLVTALWIVGPLWSPSITPEKARIRLRWRPPLRAPPISL